MGVPPGTVHRTKPQLALEMLESALGAGVPARWVVADEVHGSDGKLGRALEGRGQAYVLAVRSNGKPSTWPPYGTPGQAAVPDLGATIPTEGWERHSCGEGSQGPCPYGWAYLPLRPALGQDWYRHITLAPVALATLAAGAAKRGRALPRARPPHRPGNPSTPGPPPVGHETDARINRGLVPLEASAPEDSPTMLLPSPLETTRGTVILTHTWQIHHSGFVSGLICEGTINQIRNEIEEGIYNPGDGEKDWSE